MQTTQTTISPDDFLDEDGNPRRRNQLISTLVEGDVIIDGENIMHVAEGEVSIYSDGRLDTSQGRLAAIDQEGLAMVMGGNGTIFNLEDVK